MTTEYMGLSPDGYLKPLYGSSNLSDVPDKPTALTNLGAASADDVLRAANPIGTIIAYFGATAPYGYVPCSGQTVSRSTFPSLVTFLGGTTSATLPDMRGEFLRGWDNGRGVDAGRGLRTFQADMLGSHSHLQTFYPTGGAATNRNLGDSVGNVSGAPTTSNNSTLAAGGTETRPRNIAVLYCMKAYDAPVSATSINIAALAAEIAGRTTAPQFDNTTTSWATTAFVQRAIGSYNGFIGINADRSVVVSDIGKVIWVGTLGVTLTLPTPSSLGLPPGASFTLFTSSAPITVVSGAGATLNSSNATVASVTYKTGQCATFVVIGTSQWQMISSNADLGNNGDFQASIGTSGYQKLPSGLILQWGLTPLSSASADVSVNFPIVFPNACRSINLMLGAVNSAIVPTIGVLAASSFTVSTWISSTGVRTPDRLCYYTAIGN